MEYLVLFIVLSLLLLRIAPALGEITQNACSAKFQEDDERQVNKTGLHFSLHHVHGPCSPLNSPSPLLISDILAQDEARVRSLNSRLSRTTSSSSSSSLIQSKPIPTDLLRPKSVGVPLKPGYSIGTGNYYVNMGLGTPPKYFPMVIDTGSSFTWLQCEPCVIYCHPQVVSIFDPNTSNTYNRMSCNTPQCSALESATLNPQGCTRSNLCLYQASYGDRSFSIGYLSRDTLTMAPSQTLPGFVFGCGQDNEGLFGKSAGLIGLGRHKLSLFSQLSTKYGNSFSYCLPTPTSTSAGTLSIGPSSLNPSLYKFTPMITDPRETTLYFLRLTAILVNGKPLTVSPTQYRTSTIIDSGTVITRLPATLYTALQQTFVKAMSSRYVRADPYSILDTCFKGSVTSVPEVSLVFQGGAELKLGTQNIVLEVDKGITCLAFAANSGSGGVSIIGNRQQQTFSVAYDVSNSRIGFAAGGCR